MTFHVKVYYGAASSSPVKRPGGIQALMTYAEWIQTQTFFPNVKPHEIHWSDATAEGFADLTPIESIRFASICPACPTAATNCLFTRTATPLRARSVPRATVYCRHDGVALTGCVRTVGDLDTIRSSLASSG